MKRTAIRLMVIGLLLLSILAVPFVSACAQQPEPAPAPAPAPAAKVYDWKCTHFLLRGSESWRITSEWIDMINKASGGRLNIEFMGAGEIMPVIETWDAVSRGVIQMNVTCPGYWLGKTPIANFADPIPGSMRDVRDAYAVFHQLGVEELVRKGYGQHNIYLVEITPSYPTTLMTQFPVTKLSDLKGRKLRSMGQAAAVLTEAGASTVYLPAGEIYGALEKGLVEGATWGSINTCVEMGWHEVTKYILMPDLFPVLCSDVQVNLDVWNELPADLKELLMISGPRLNEIYSAQVAAWDAREIAKVVEENGFTLTTMSDEERRKLSQYGVELMDKYAAEDPLCAEAAAIQKDYMKKIGLLD